MKEKLQVIISISIIGFLIIVFQYDSLNLGMHGDDYVIFRSYSVNDLLLVFWTNLLHYNEGVALSAYRPLYRPMFHLAYKVCGFNPYNLHMLLIILQILQTVLAFLFFRMLTKNNSVALVSSLLFPLNPNLYMHFTWNTEISAASGMIPLLLSLMALISYIRSQKNIMIFFHCFFALLAYLTKETYAPLFFISILTVIFYRKQNYRQYLLILGWHLVIFITYLAARFVILREWGGQGVTPDAYSGITKFIWNYVWFIGQISLFNHYIFLGPFYLLLYLGIAFIFLLALKSALMSYGEASRKVLLCVSVLALLVQTYWLLTHINIMPELLLLEEQYEKGFIVDSRRYMFFLVLYSVCIYTIIMLSWIRHNKMSYFNKHSLEQSSHLLDPSKTNKLSNLNSKDTLVRFFSYSFLFLLISGLPMFFFPEGRIMNVSAIGMGGIYGSAVFIVVSLIRESKLRDTSPFSRKGLLVFSIMLATALFFLNNGLMFKNKYVGTESYSKDSVDIMAYVMRYPFFVKHKLTEHGTYLFNYLVSKELVDKTTGMLIRENIAILYPEVIECMSEERLFTFKPSDSTIYPFTGAIIKER